MTTVTKVKYYNQCRFGEEGDWEDMCHGHATQEEAILCQEKAHKKGLETPQALIMIALSEALVGRLQARIIRRTAVITDEVVEEAQVMYSRARPKVEPEVRHAQEESTKRSE